LGRLPELLLVLVPPVLLVPPTLLLVPPTLLLVPPTLLLPPLAEVPPTLLLDVPPVLEEPPLAEVPPTLLLDVPPVELDEPPVLEEPPLAEVPPVGEDELVPPWPEPPFWFEDVAVEPPLLELLPPTELPPPFDGEEPWQFPFEQLPEEHLLPHLPQLLASVANVTQLPLQFSWPEAQVAEQLPLLQSGVDPVQTLPHLPQLLASTEVFVQVWVPLIGQTESVADGQADWVTLPLVQPKDVASKRPTPQLVSVFNAMVPVVLFGWRPVA
jgi:hypothetical protein